MEQKELNALFLEQIKARDEIINKLLIDLRTKDKIILIQSVLFFLIIIFSVFCYFGLDWTSSNYNENINRNITEEAKE